jgi:hypothetical protein
MKQVFDVIMNGTESDTQIFIKEFRDEFKSVPIEDIAKTSGTDDIEKYKDRVTLFKKGCPIHVRGSILYNDYLKKKGLNKKFVSINSGDKVKLVYLKVPNPLQQNVISFPGVLPKEMELTKYIDYDTQFSKVFLTPIQGILDALGWSAEKIDTIEDFFT